jgi:hypothetical protein
VGKTIPEVRKAYLAGFIHGDGAIMTLLERHPAKQFGCRIRVWVKATNYVSVTCRGYAKSSELAEFKQVTVVGNGWSKTSRMRDGFFKRFDRLPA